MIETSKVDLNLLNTSIFVFDIDGVIRDVSGSYRRALADTVEYFTNADYAFSRDLPQDEIYPKK
jgi:HAD superfamily phosphatase